MTVRTLAMRFMTRALTPGSAPGAAPKPGSYDDAERFTAASLALLHSCFQFA